MSNRIYLALFASAACIATFLPQYALAGDIAKGKAQFATLCATCHGAAGAGDGPVAAALPPDQKPANFVSGAFKFATDEAKFKELLHKGGAGVGLNPLMPPQAGLSDADISDLYAYVQSLRKK